MRRHFYSYSSPVMRRLLEETGFRVSARVFAPAVSYIVYYLNEVRTSRGPEKIQIGYAGLLSRPYQLANKVLGRSLAALRMGSNVFVFAVRA